MVLRLRQHNIGYTADGLLRRHHTFRQAPHLYKDTTPLHRHTTFTQT